MGVLFTCLALLLATGADATARVPPGRDGLCAVRILREERVSRGDTNVRRVQPIDDAAWIGAEGLSMLGGETFDTTHEIAGSFSGDFFRFTCPFVATGEDLEFDISADERFVLMLDGAVIARGPHRGMVEHWYYQSYRITRLAAGDHRLEAIVWRLGPHAPLAQLSHRGGSLIVKAYGSYDAKLTTGKGAWRYGRLEGTRMTGVGTSRTFGAGSECVINGASFLDEVPPQTHSATIIRPPIKETPYGIRASGWMLFPTERRDQMSEPVLPGRFVAVADGADFAAAYREEHAKDARLAALAKLGREAVTIEPGRQMRLLWDLGDYYCAYPELILSGGRGARIWWGWTESLRDAANKKGDRNAFIGKSAQQSFTDTFICDGRARARFTTPWWRCGRWCQLVIETGDEPLRVEALRLIETRYPMDVTGSFSCDDASVNDIWRICRRTMACCQHEMFFDCPYYEQQMYPGDTRNELLTLYALTSEAAMPHFAAGIFDYARRDNGLVPMNFPSRGMQESPTYTMSWLLMFRDYMMYHRDTAWLKARLPGVRNALSGLLTHVGASGLVEDLPGWNFCDWTEAWGEAIGAPPGGRRGEGPGAFNNLMLVYALQSVAAVERALGNASFAAAWLEQAARLRREIDRRFWVEARGLFADDIARTQFSEHAQILAILTQDSAAERVRLLERLIAAKDLVPCSPYFMHYFFDACMAAGRADLILKRLDFWRDFLAVGAKTTFETQGEGRSDCHAWSACPIYALATGIAGISPAAPFFRRVRIAPQPAGLGRISCRMPHPDGVVAVDLAFKSRACTGTVALPPGVEGDFVWEGRVLSLPASSTHHLHKINIGE